MLEYAVIAQVPEAPHREDYERPGSLQASVFRCRHDQPQSWTSQQRHICRLGADGHQGEVGVHIVPYLAREVTVGEKVKHSLIYLITQWADRQTGWFSGACHSRRSAVQQWFVAASHTKILHFKGGPSSPDCIHSGDLAMPANRAEYADFTMCCPTLTTTKRFDPLLGATELGHRRSKLDKGIS
jgi:hypothetical protein